MKIFPEIIGIQAFKIFRNIVYAKGLPRRNFYRLVYPDSETYIRISQTT